MTGAASRARGTPRRRLAAGRSVGDCVDCNACVAVCPMGIDIRDGQQLECITCALCIDACDGVMDKIGKERGLISYATLNDYNANMALATGGGTRRVDPARVRDAGGRLRRRARAFPPAQDLPAADIRLSRRLVGWSVSCLLYALLSRDRLEINVLHDRNPQFVTLSDGSIRNGYTVKLLNMIPEPRTIIVLSIAGACRRRDERRRRRSAGGPILRRAGRAGPAEDAEGLRAAAAR